MTSRERSTFDRRPPFALLAFGLGGVFVCVRLAADIQARAVGAWELYAVLWAAAGFVGYVGLGVAEMLFGWLVRLLGAATDNDVRRIEAEALLARARPWPVETAALPAGGPREVPYHAGGRTGTLPVGTDTALARRQAWQKYMVEHLPYLRATNGNITASALVGPGRAFTRPEAWGLVVDQLAAQGWATARRAGVASRLTVPLGEIERAILGGQVEWDTANDPPALPGAATGRGA